MRLFYPPVGARYINRQVLGIFLVALSILLSIALGDRLIQFLEKAAAGNIPADRVFYIVLLRMPELIQVVLPFALYIGPADGARQALFQSGNERAAQRWPAHAYPSDVAAAGYFTGELSRRHCLHQSSPQRQKFALEQELVLLQKRIGLSLLQPGIFRIENGGEQVTYSNALADDDQTILDVFIQRQMADGRQMTVWAEQGQRSQADAQGRQTLTLKNGRRYVGSAGRRGLRNHVFCRATNQH
jgi:lipopolysaccharide export LptBFGC system permease protein LptF